MQDALRVLVSTEVLEALAPMRAVQAELEGQLRDLAREIAETRGALQRPAEPVLVPSAPMPAPRVPSAFFPYTAPSAPPAAPPPYTELPAAELVPVAPPPQYAQPSYESLGADFSIPDALNGRGRRRAAWVVALFIVLVVGGLAAAAIASQSGAL
jgi:hypothetical protein